MKFEVYNGYMKFQCFNNQDIQIIGQIQMELRSGSWTAKICNILLVQHKSQNLMIRDILTKLGLALTQQQATKDRRLLKQPVLLPAAIWDMDQDSEPELNIQYREAAEKEPQTGNNTATESDDSENAPLLSPTRTPGRLHHQNLRSHLEIKHQR